MNDLETAELLAKIVKRWPNISAEQFAEWETGLPNVDHGTTRQWLNQVSQQAGAATFDDYLHQTPPNPTNTLMTVAEQQTGLANVQHLRDTWAHRHQGANT